MFNVGFGELTFIMVVALLVLGPRKLPELARGIGKFMREFRRQSEDIRHTVEQEFYRMDRELEDVLPKLDPPEGTQSVPSLHQAPPLPEAGAEGHAPTPGDAGPEPHTPLSPPAEALAPTLATPPADAGTSAADASAADASPAATLDGPAPTGTDGRAGHGEGPVDA